MQAFTVQAQASAPFNHKMAGSAAGAGSEAHQLSRGSSISSSGRADLEAGEGHSIDSHLWAGRLMAGTLDPRFNQVLEKRRGDGRGASGEAQIRNLAHQSYMASQALR